MLLAILDFARIASALVVVVGVSHQSPWLGAELLLVLEDVGLRAPSVEALTIAQRCYDCEECCSQTFERAKRSIVFFF